MGNKNIDDQPITENHDNMADNPNNEDTTDNVKVNYSQVLDGVKSRKFPQLGGAGEVWDGDREEEDERNLLTGTMKGEVVETSICNLDQAKCETSVRENEDNDGDGDDDDGDEERTDNKNKDHSDSALLQDQGWAWFICLGCFLSHVITGGFERSDGVMFLEFTDRFHESAQLTAWPAAVCSTLRLLMGPVATAMSNRFSVRTSTMLGSLIFAGSLVMCGMAPNIPYLILTYGVIQGLGRGLVYAPGLVIVGMYFNRYRGLGTGLATAGVGVGTFIGPPLVEWLFQEVGFQGAFLLLGGIALNTCIAASLYRPFFVHRNIVLGGRSSPKDEEAALCSPANENKECREENQLKSAIPNHTPPSRQTHSKGCEFTQTENRTTPSKNPLRPVKKSKLLKCLKSAFQTCFPIEKKKKDSPKRKLIEWTLLKNPSFVFFCLSICLFTAAFKSAFTFLPAMAKSHGVSVSNAVYLLSISGILDTIGRVMSGLILDIDCIRPFRPIIYNTVIFVIMGLSFLSPYMGNFVQFAVLFGMYGMLTGTYVSQKSVILVDILGQEKLSSSFGLLICFQGIGTFIGPPLSGLLKDILGRYNEVFFLGGACMGVAGLLMIVSNVYRVLQNRRQKNEATVVVIDQNDV